MPLAAVGYLDGTLAIYDLSTQTLRHQCQHQVQAASSHGHGHSLGEAQIFESTYPRPGSRLVPLCGPSSLPPALSTPFLRGSWEQMPLVSPAPDLHPACCALVQSGIVQLLWEAGTAVVYTCSLDGIVRLWDARTGRLLTDYRGHTAEILDFALSK